MRDHPEGEGRPWVPGCVDEPSAPPSSVRPLPVLFIGGAGRSGSTLLDRLLGQVPGVVSVGEISNIWETGFRFNYPCGCGALFADCPFWQQVVRGAFGGASRLDLDEVRRLRRRVQRGVGKLRLLSPIRGAAFRAQLHRYSALVESLLRSAATIAGAQVVVDSSKLPSHGLVLASRPGIELHVVHLLRESRAVAFSWQRRRVRRRLADGEELLPRLSPWRSALRYWSGNLPMEGLRPRASTFVRLRYEDLVEQPETTLRQILGVLGHPAQDLAFLDGHRAYLGKNHLADGNPMRLRHGLMTIAADDEWQRAMPRGQRLLVRLMTLPLRLLYGYEGG